MNPARQLASVLVDLLRRERDALADFLTALADFDRQRAWEKLGHASLFAFLVKDLGLSNGAAAYRKAAVELVQRFPQVLEPVRDGRLCVTTVFELSKVITEENAAEVLPRFFGASRRDAQDVVAELAPRPAPARTVVTAIHAPQPGPGLLHSPSGRLADHVRASSEPMTQLGRELPLSPRTVVEPRTAELSRVHLTVPRSLLAKLATARDALSHSHPGASDAEILEVGLDLVIDRHRKRRGIGAKPRRGKADASGPPASDAHAAEARVGAPTVPPPPAKRSRYIPAAVRRAVWERDGGRCAFPLDGGGVCGSTHQLEYDHVRGFALGAGNTVDELRVACRRHQDVHARALYGDDLMDRYTRPNLPPRTSEPVAAYGGRVSPAWFTESERERGVSRWARNRPSDRTRRDRPPRVGAGAHCARLVGHASGRSDVGGEEHVRTGRPRRSSAP